MQGMVVPATYRLSPHAALLLSALKLPLYVIAGHVSSIGMAADAATAAMTAEVRMSQGYCVATALGRRDGYADGGGVPFGAVAVTTMALLITPACHVSVQM
ncbi:hypothetical protein Vafri_13501 [Volvox africanus]|nr:hypothetical protein Vafri_13501 [Volvox africanus]